MLRALRPSYVVQLARYGAEAPEMVSDRPQPVQRERSSEGLYAPRQQGCDERPEEEGAGGVRAWRAHQDSNLKPAD